MEGPLLVLKSWMLTTVAIWIYQRWFQRVAPPTPSFEAFCAERPVVAALFGLAGSEPRAVALLADRLGKRSESVATLGGFPWPHYRLQLTIEQRAGAVLLRVTGAQVVRTRDRDVPALASLVRAALNDLPEGTQAWLHAGTFNNGLVAVPAGGWALEPGTEQRPRLRALQDAPSETRLSAQGDAHLEARVRVAPADVAAHALNQALHQRKPDAGALVLAGELALATEERLPDLA